MYFFACIINTFKQTFTDLQAVGLTQKIVDYRQKKKFLLVFKCSWAFPNKSVLIFLSFSSSLLMVLFLIIIIIIVDDL